MSDEETQWVVYWGGTDPDSCAGWRVCDDEADAHEEARWRIDGGVAKRPVTYGGWWVCDADRLDNGLNSETMYIRVMRDVIG
jgi:hypothetical protein